MDLSLCLCTENVAGFKTIQCAIFGVILAFVYYKTRNLFAVAAVHSLDDFLPRDVEIEKKSKG